MLIMMYFSFTTLSTIGLGDYNPRSDFERLFIVVTIMFGVAILSLFMENFKELVEKI